MNLTTVTITGADESVDPRELDALSAEFDFVEWGILSSTKRRGREPRYPSLEWIDRFLYYRLPAALHACGEYSRQIIAGNGFAHPGFARVQLNGFVDHVREAGGIGSEGIWKSPQEKILQCQHTTDGALAGAAFVAAHMDRTSVLYDPSGGRGRVQQSWPLPPEDVRMGYAGGIGPDNVVDVLTTLTAIPGGDFWIDMESGVRDAADRFDLDRVRKVLEHAASFVHQPGGRERVINQVKVGSQPPSGYIGWHVWADAQAKGGLRQQRRACCGLWKFPQERCDHGDGTGSEKKP